MSTAIIDNIDWLKYMRVYGFADADSFEEHFDTDWISAQCRKAALICLSECPIVRTRLKKGRLSESDFASVVCEMVLRVVRFNRFKTEANGSYSYTEHDPQQNQPGYDPSPRLFLSKAEKSILNGFAESAGTMSHISLGFDPGYGG